MAEGNVASVADFIVMGNQFWLCSWGPAAPAATTEKRQKLREKNIYKIQTKDSGNERGQSAIQFNLNGFIIYLMPARLTETTHKHTLSSANPPDIAYTTNYLVASLKCLIFHKNRAAGQQGDSTVFGTENGNQIQMSLEMR